MLAADLETGKLVSALAVLFGETMSADRLELYVSALDDVRPAHLKAGFARAIKTRNWFPKPAELRADVDAALEQQRERELQRAMDAERQLRRAPVVRPVGRMSKLSVLAQFGGFTALEPCECPDCVLAHPQ